MPDPRHPVNVSEVLALAALGRDGQEAAARALAARTAVLGDKRHKVVSSKVIKPLMAQKRASLALKLIASMQKCN